MKTINCNMILLVASGTKDKKGRSIYQNILIKTKKEFSDFNVEMMFLSDKEIDTVAVMELFGKKYEGMLIQPVFVCNFETYNRMAAKVHGENIVFGEHIINSADDFPNLLPLFQKDISIAQRGGWGIVYLGHGGKNNILTEQLDKFINENLPGSRCYFGLIHGESGINEILSRIKDDNIQKVLLKPFMLTDGYHVNKEFDLINIDSFFSQLKSMLKEVIPIREVLGENDIFLKLIFDKINKKIQEFRL